MRDNSWKVLILLYEGVVVACFLIFLLYLYIGGQAHEVWLYIFLFAALLPLIIWLLPLFILEWVVEWFSGEVSMNWLIIGGASIVAIVLILVFLEDRKKGKRKKSQRKLYEDVEGIEQHGDSDICLYATSDPEFKSRIKKRYRQAPVICKADRKPCEHWPPSKFDWRGCARLPGSRGGERGL